MEDAKRVHVTCGSVPDCTHRKEESFRHILVAVPDEHTRVSNVARGIALNIFIDLSSRLTQCRRMQNVIIKLHEERHHMNRSMTIACNS